MITINELMSAMRIPVNPPENELWRLDIWTDESEIMCRTEQVAETIANMFDAVCGMVSHIGYYDPEDDAKEPYGPFKTTGWYYIDFD